MVGISGGKMIVNSGKWPCESGFTGGICGDLLLVAAGFRCKRCDGTIQEADVVKDLMVDASEEWRKLVGVHPITTVIRSGRLRWYGHLMRK